MNIKSLNSTYNLKATNPLNKKNNHNQNPSFSGCVLTQDTAGNNIYKIFVPNAPQGTKVEYVTMTKNKDGVYKAHSKPQTRYLPTGYQPLILTDKDINLDKNSTLGYKITVPGSPLYRESCAADMDSGYYIANAPSDPNLSSPKVIEHIFVDAFNVKDDKALHSKRNHFNIMGGTINSVNEKIPALAEAGITDVLGNPLIGQDNKSSQGYWTTNPYQITRNLGTITDFKNLMVNLFRHDMRWIADGAFVNEGIEGIHIEDIANFGTQSPFVNYFETKDLDSLTAKFGIYSKNSNVNKHIHIQLVNAPYKINFVKDGDKYIEKDVKRVSYDSTKPTYIQVFDDRLASEEQMNGSDIFDIYANKTTGDDFEITNYMGSVQPIHRKVTPKEVEDNYKKYKEARHYDKNIEFKNSLSRWTNFEFDISNKNSGISLWVGNADISKKRFVLPEQSVLDQLKDKSRKPLIEAAPYQVQDDTVQVGKFWTNEVSRTLAEEAAREIGQKVNEGSSYKDAIDILIKEQKLPQKAKIVYEKDDNGISALDNILEKDFFDENERNYKLKPFKMPESITDGLMAFPMDAIEFAPDLAGALSYPHIKNLAVTEDTVGLSRYDMYKMGDEYYNQMPERYRAQYKKMDNVIANDMSVKTKDIINKLSEKLNIKMLDAKGELTQEGKEIYALIAPDIAKFLVISALAPKIQFKENDKFLEYDPDELRKISQNSLNLQYEISPEELAAALTNKIKKGVNSISAEKQADFVNHLEKRLRSVNSDSINVARLIMEKTESGLSWRIDAAKDVAAPELVEDARFDDNANKQAVMKFWNKFNEGTFEYNPKRYSIGELTNWPSSIFSEFKQKTGFSTISDYEYFYSSILGAFGVNSEGAHIGSLNEVIQDKLFGKSDYAGFLDSGNEESINYAHRFIGNHDKPRVLHLLALDMLLFLNNKNEAMSKALVEGFHNTERYQALDDNFKASIYEVITKVLEKGKYLKNGKEVIADSENFGVRPFDFNIDLVIEQTKEKNAGFKHYAQNNPAEIKKLKADVLQTILKPALEKYRAIWFTMNALPGAPTNYAGDEFGMTGWETACKNEKQENRNPIRWDRLDDNDYKFIKEYKSKIDDISKIRKKEAASALSNGSTIKLEDQPVQGERSAVALYRYNDKTDAVCVLHNAGFGGDRNLAGYDLHLNSIKLGGLPNGLIEGTIYRDALNPESKYKVTNPYEIKKIDDNGNIQEDINLGNAGIILLREKDFKGKELSFKGRIENANVKLANTKFNIAAPSYKRI